MTQPYPSETWEELADHQLDHDPTPVQAAIRAFEYGPNGAVWHADAVSAYPPDIARETVYGPERDPWAFIIDPELRRLLSTTPTPRVHPERRIR